MPSNPNDEVKEMNDIFNDIQDKTDEELKQLDEESTKKLDEGGDPNKDLTEPVDPNPVVTDPVEPAPDPVVKPDTDADDTTALRAQVADLEQQLKKEHQRTSSWDGRIKSANTRVSELETENQFLKDQLAKVPTVKTDEENTEQEVMNSFKETFPEFTEVLDIMQKKIDANIKPAVESAPAKVEPDPDTPVVDEPAISEDAKIAAQAKHMGEIRKAHPAIDEMVKAGVILTWINGQPDFISSHLEDIYYNGSSDKIIKMITEFSAKTGWTSSLNTGKAKQDKLNSMLEAEGSSAGPKSDGPDKNDFAQGAKDAGL